MAVPVTQADFSVASQRLRVMLAPDAQTVMLVSCSAVPGLLLSELSKADHKHRARVQSDMTKSSIKKAHTLVDKF